MRRSLGIGAAAFAALSIFFDMPADAQTSPVSDLIYVTDLTGAIVFEAPITEANEQSEAVNGIFVHPFPIPYGNLALLGSPILLLEPGTPDWRNGVSDFVAVWPDGSLVFGSAVGPDLIPASYLAPFTVTPVTIPETGPVDVTAYINPAAGFPAGYTMYFQSIVPEPSTWAMMMLGFGALVFAAFRRAGRSP